MVQESGNLKVTQHSSSNWKLRDYTKNSPRFQNAELLNERMDVVLHFIAATLPLYLVSEDYNIASGAISTFVLIYFRDFLILYAVFKWTQNFLNSYV